MTKNQNLFFSCVDSRIQDQGSMYARFHLGTFFRGQSLTFANALRRVLLSEIPGIIIKEVRIEGAGHEFATIPGVQETVLDILLNLKKLVFTPVTTNLTELENFQTKAFLKSQGPAILTAADLKLPPTVKCIDPNASIATLTTGGELALCLELHFVNPNSPLTSKKKNLSQTQIKNFSLDTLPMPVQKVNYVIKELDAKNGSEYVVLEIWTDGSLTPQDILQFALKNLTQLFYQFAELKK
jgi:DNA-directed RNA polymerase subunit alpha